MLSKRRPGITLALSAAAAIAIIAAGTAAMAAGNATQRQWPSQSYPKQPIEVRICSCRYAGNSIPIGQTICMSFQGRRVLAKCDSVVNTPSWSISSQSCPQS